MNNPRTRLLICGLILLAQALGYIAGYANGWFDPFERFQLLMVIGNLAAAGVIIFRGGDLYAGAGVMLLIAAQALIGHRVAPDNLTSGAMLMVNILTFYVGLQINRHLPFRHWLIFVASYFLLYYIFIVRMENAEPLFLLFLMGLAATARSLRLLSYFWALTLSFTLCQPYAWEACFVLFFTLTALFGARAHLPSRAALVFLGAGLALVFLVLWPVLIMLMSEDLHNIESMLRDPRITAALWTTLYTAAISTGVLALFGIPLAYGLSRIRFPGRTLLIVLIDMPIVIPQSVAGIALVRVFGRQQILGELILDTFGIAVDGTWLGVCVAQVFVAMPFLVRSAIAAFDGVDPHLELAARTLGASSWGAFKRVALPLASRGIFLGVVLAFARAAGEFGALVILAPTPETAPVAAYNRFQSVGIIETAPLVATLLLFSVAMFLLLHLVGRMLPSVRQEKEAF